MTKKEQLKLALHKLAKELIENRKRTPELSAPSHFLIDEVSTSYELKILKEELRQLKFLVDELLSFGMEVSTVSIAKVEIMEARISKLKSYVSQTAKVNRIVKKAADARYEEIMVELKAEREDATNTEVTPEVAEVETVVNEVVEETSEFTTELKKLAEEIVVTYNEALTDGHEQDVLQFIIEEVVNDNCLNEIEFEILNGLVSKAIKENST